MLLCCLVSGIVQFAGKWIMRVKFVLCCLGIHSWIHIPNNLTFLA